MGTLRRRSPRLHGLQMAAFAFALLLPLGALGGAGALEAQGMGQQLRQGADPVRVFRIAPDFWANYDPEERTLSVQGTTVRVPPGIELEQAFTPPVSDWFIVIDGFLYDDLDVMAASMGGVFNPRVVEGYLSHEMIRESYGSDWYEAGVFGFMLIRTRDGGGVREPGGPTRAP
jgi:hypothetical protein